MQPHPGTQDHTRTETQKEQHLRHQGGVEHREKPGQKARERHLPTGGTGQATKAKSNRGSKQTGKKEPSKKTKSHTNRQQEGGKRKNRARPTALGVPR